MPTLPSSACSLRAGNWRRWDVLAHPATGERKEFAYQLLAMP